MGSDIAIKRQFQSLLCHPNAALSFREAWYKTQIKTLALDQRPAMPEKCDCLIALLTLSRGNAIKTSKTFWIYLSHLLCCFVIDLNVWIHACIAGICPTIFLMDQSLKALDSWHHYGYCKIFQASRWLRNFTCPSENSDISYNGTGILMATLCLEVSQLHL